MIKDGSIIILAWPQTKVKKAGAWYDKPASWFGLCKNNYYEVGHSACILVNHTTGETNYFDFGRYQTPKGMGRVRDKVTDPELTLQNYASIRSGMIINTDEILLEIAANKSNHGTGKMIASVYNGLNYNEMYTTAKRMQANDSMHYGPFDVRGTNCARFVANVMQSGKPDLLARLFINYPYTISPTPVTNVKIGSNQPYYYTVEDGIIKLENDLILSLRQLLNPEKQEIIQPNYR